MTPTKVKSVTLSGLKSSDVSETELDVSETGLEVSETELFFSSIRICTRLESQDRLPFKFIIIFLYIHKFKMISDGVQQGPTYLPKF